MMSVCGGSGVAFIYEPARRRGGHCKYRELENRPDGIALEEQHSTMLQPKDNVDVKQSGRAAGALVQPFDVQGVATRTELRT